MPFVGDFSVAQNDESTITLTDISTGSDPTITERRIFPYKYDGTTIVPTGTLTNYIVWDIDDATITLSNILSRDFAVRIQVQWIAPNPDPANTYIATHLYDLEFYGMLFLAQLTTEDSARKPNFVDDLNYLFNKFKLYDYIIQARISVGLMNDIMKGQFNLDMAYNMRIKQTTFF